MFIASAARRSGRLVGAARGAVFALAFALIGPRVAAAQTDDAAAAPAADPADVASVDAIMAALYDVISGPAGAERDWDRFRSLFLPGARLIGTGRTPAGEVRYRVMTPDDYIRMNAPILEERGFFERELGRAVETFGNITHAFSAYESRIPADGDRIMRGMNSVQLLNDGTRWWVVTILWDSERPGQPIPEKYQRSN